ncbi:hypothetical protein QQA04_13520, partial [Corynebacterium striatum]|nr:hypothetical protein [Corynebacterium striatum]
PFAVPGTWNPGTNYADSRYQLPQIDRILSYLKNYHDLCVQVFGEEKAGLDLSVLIEFGTTSQTAIELQQSGFSRDISSELLEKGSGYLEIGETGTILDINVQGIISDEHLSAPVKQETKDLFAA